MLVSIISGGDRGDNELTAVNLAPARGARNRTLIESQPREKYAQGASECSTGVIGKAVELFCSKEISALDRRDLTQVNIPFLLVIFRRTQIELIRLARFARPHLHGIATLAEIRNGGYEPPNRFPPT